MLQSHAVIQLCSAEGEDRPYEGTFETVIFCDFVERGLAVRVSDFLHSLLHFWGIQLHPPTPPNPFSISLSSLIYVKLSLASCHIFTFSNTSSIFDQSPMLASLLMLVELS